MSEERVLREFSERLKNDVADAHAESGEEGALSWDVALTQVALGYLGDAGEVPSFDLCPHQDTEGRDRCKVIAYNLEEDGTRLDVFTSIHVVQANAWEIPVIPREDVKRAAHRALRFARFAAARDIRRFEGSPEAAAAAREIRRRIRDITEVAVHVVTNGLVRDHELPLEDEDGRRNRTRIWDVEFLRRAAEEEGGAAPVIVDFTKLMGRPLPVLEMKPPAAEYQTFMAVLPAELLCSIYEEHRARLFERNVRSFLQATGKVNKGIRKTLIEEPERFLAYNNGLTATAVEIEACQWHGETVIKALKGLQIVNGAQTTASIHRAKIVDKLDISRVAVAMKLTGVKAEKLDEFVVRISECANTQNPVQVADLSANTPFHVTLEQLANSVRCPGLTSRWFYERARGAYQVERSQAVGNAAKRAFDAERPKSQKFGKTDLAKFWMSCFGKPHIVSRGSQKNYAAFMKEIPARYPADWVPDERFLKETAAIALVFRSAQAVARKADLGSYVANVVTYMVARLLDDRADVMDLEGIWDRQGCSDELKAVFASWAPLVHRRLVSSSGKENVTEWAKREECWGVIKAMPLPWPDEPPPECRLDDEELGGEEVEGSPEAPAASAVPDGGSPIASATGATPPGQDADDPYIRRCLAVDQEDWGRVMDWVASPGARGMFAPKDINIANQVALWARMGWTGRPSPKQAYCAAKVLDGAERQNII